MTAMSSLAPDKNASHFRHVLNVSNCDHMGHKGLTSVLNVATGLRQLILAYYSLVTPSLASSLQKLGKLESIKLDGCSMTTSGLIAIGSSCIALKELSLSKCSGVTDEGLSYVVAKHRDLLKLDITCCRMITDASLASITSSCTSLISLRMESCSLISKYGFVLIGQRCRLLEELDLTDTELDNEGLKAISGCYKLSSLKIGICLNINEEGLVHVGNGCREIHELDLYRSVGVTDASISAIARGCPMLQIINLAYCTKITNNALRSLSKCSMLNTLEIRGCSQVSSAALYDIALGCRQIIKLDIKKCYNIDDAGMLPLARFSQNLREINLSYCSISDVGLLSLASISCLQNMTILHVRGLTPNGLVAALLACGGLTKVKLHSSFKSLIPKPFFEHLQARGCTFHWRDKPFQIEVDAVELWKQQSQEILVV
ncbi:putative F-box/LRR-repeat protein 3 [Iris pallida]|uniref:F-box/LRR-repeat protein 3 n=1 Tax=Iris pallida TaxID=29817 RepID=A0AAX6EHM5_IRIPA|nr:putative F-box/LRR-repeat protein 3 [Iris pallida]